MSRDIYICPICGKKLKLSGPRNIEFHEKSKFHLDAMKLKNEGINNTPIEDKLTSTVVAEKPISKCSHKAQIPANELKCPMVGVKTTKQIPIVNDKNKTTEDNKDGFDGYLTF